MLSVLLRAQIYKQYIPRSASLSFGNSSAEFVASIAMRAPAGPPGAFNAARAELSSNGVRRARNSSASSSGASWCTSR
jgi:hypothetical protein